MNDNIDWNSANGNTFASGPACTNHARPLNGTVSFYCLAIHNRKTQGETKNLSEEPAINPFGKGVVLLRCWYFKNLPIHFVFYGDIGLDLSGRCCFGIISQWYPTHSIISGKERSGEKQRGWGRAMERWVITKKKNRSLLPFIRASIKYCLGQVHFVPFCFLCKLNI